MCPEVIKVKHSNGNRFRAFALAVAFILIIAAVLPAAGCSKKNGKVVVPEGLTREEAALYMAVAKVCPKTDNHSKVEYLTFYIEGWSFDELPKAVFDYLSEYCAAGGARMMQFSMEALEGMGLIARGDGDFFGEDERVYAEGKGKAFTFALKEGQDPAKDELLVSVTGFISDRDSSGFDVELNYSDDSWQFVKYVNAWNQYQFFTPDPAGTKDPER